MERNIYCFLGAVPFELWFWVSVNCWAFCQSVWAPAFLQSQMNIKIHCECELCSYRQVQHRDPTKLCGQSHHVFPQLSGDRKRPGGPPRHWHAVLKEGSCANDLNLHIYHGVILYLYWLSTFTSPLNNQEMAVKYADMWYLIFELSGWQFISVKIVRCYSQWQSVFILSVNILAQEA